MPRQKKCRTIQNPPINDGYKPMGIATSMLDSICLQLEEYESIRLCDYDNLKQEKAAIKMNVSRPTFTRIYNSARKKIALAFIEGKILYFKGGDVNTKDSWYKCKNCNEIFKNDKSETIKCPSCNSENFETLEENIASWNNKQMKEHSCKKNNIAQCVSCGYKTKNCKKNDSCPQCGNRMQIINEENNITMKKIAIPVENGNLCPHFGGAKHFEIIDIENNKIIKRNLIEAPVHQTGLLPKWLGAMNVTDVIAGGMGERAYTLLEQNKIIPHTGVANESTDSIINKFLSDELIITSEKCSHEHGANHGEKQIEEGNHDNCGNPLNQK